MTFFFANWKMYLGQEDSLLLAREIAVDALHDQGLVSGIFPTMLSLNSVADMLKESALCVGAQHVAWAPKGAYTGAVSAALCKEVGSTYALVGHSERRYIFGEKDVDIRKRVGACTEVGLTPVLCVGETAKERDAGLQKKILEKQLVEGLAGLSFEKDGLVIAYEPVWAISGSGDGECCDPLYAEEAHRWIKGCVSDFLTESVPVLYGGSVNADNVVSYISQKDIDGVLVGSAATTKAGYLAIQRAIISTL